MTETNRSKKRVFQIVVLTAMLVVVPLISWYFLKGGLDYRLDALEELQELGSFQAGDWLDQTGELLDSVQLGKRLMIAGILPDDDQDLFLEELVMIHDQFDERQDVLFLTFTTPDEFGRPLPEESQLDPLQWKWIALESGELESLVDNLKLGEFPGKPDRYLVLIDEHGEIRIIIRFQSTKRLGT